MGRNGSREIKDALDGLATALRGFDPMSGNHTPVLEAIDALVLSRVTDAVLISSESSANASAEALAKIMLDENPDFSAWTKTLDPKHWARYDLAACRLGWEAARATARERPV